MKKLGDKWPMICSCICGLMLCFYLGAIAYLNLSLTPSFYMTDMYSDAMIAVEMVKEKTLFPETWHFGNQLYAIATPTITALLYTFLKDPFVSMAIASCLATLAVIFSFDWMLRAVFSNREERLIGIVGLLGIFVVCGDAILTLNGWHLMFTMSSYYACYAITVFLAFGCFLRSHQRIPWVMLSITGLLSFAMGIQSLRQTAVMLVPLVGMAGFNMLCRFHRKEKVLSGDVLVSAVLSVTNLAGLIAKQYINVKQTEIFGKISIKAFEDFWGSFVGGLNDMCDLIFRRNYALPIPRIAVLCAFFAITLVIIYLNRQDKTAQLLALMVLSVVSILGIDVVMTMKVRDIYYFMLYPLIVCVIVYFFAKGNQRAKVLYLVVLCVLFVQSSAKNVFPYLKDARYKEYSGQVQICDDLMDRGITTVYSQWNCGEQIAVASGGEIQAGFWGDPLDVFAKVPYLCNSDVFDADADHVAYLFRSQEEVDVAISKAAEKGVELVPLTEYPGIPIYVYTASENLMLLF